MALVALLEPAPVSAGRARRFVRKSLDFLGNEESVDAAVLVASELVTNAITHGGQEDVLLELQLAGDCVRLEVWDGSEVDPVVRDIHRGDEHGRGMYIIDAICLKWGVTHYTSGKSVYAYVPLHRNI